MAFAGKGGTWLQSDKQIYNPYYGPAMLRCGGIVKGIGGGADAPKGGHGSH